MLRGGDEEALQYSHRVQLLFECLLERREAPLPHDSLYNLGGGTRRVQLVREGGGKGGAGNAVTTRSLQAQRTRGVRRHQGKT